eukprot:EG_transcript_47182
MHSASTKHNKNATWVRSLPQSQQSFGFWNHLVKEGWERGRLAHKSEWFACQQKFKKPGFHTRHEEPKIFWATKGTQLEAPSLELSADCPNSIPGWLLIGGVYTFHVSSLNTQEKTAMCEAA